MRTPSKTCYWHDACPYALPQQALIYRRKHRLLSLQSLGAFNLTAWAYETPEKSSGVYVAANTPLRELAREFAIPDLLVGVHSEMHAAEWFRLRQKLRVTSIFTERIPCFECSSMLRNTYPGVPVYYYFNRASWTQGQWQLMLRSAGQALKEAYEL